MFRTLTRTSLAGRILPLRASPVGLTFTKHLYSTQKRKVVRPENAPRIRYLFMMVLISFGMLHYVTTKVEKKVPKNSFTEREFQQYEKETGLRRRHKLVSHEKNDQYAFYVVPYCHDVQKTEKELATKLPKDRQVKVIEVSALVEKEIEEEGNTHTCRQMPRGLITAIIKQEIELFMNTTKGQFDTNIMILNYPQSTEEAIKFENDVSDVKTCIKLDDDYTNSLKSDLSGDDLRKISNVFGYFDTVHKVTPVNSKVKTIE
ncbi:CIC11C00000003503 [Sungouiella intermedia]|uniref:CIC11C00000003503 n=1 Tax=Sungouiella intermedia TaxID=45354 RepID=A0A1L0C5E2_9ASCO|nr:CIC11C00000003503 [[Candida] intermedia]